MTFNINDKVRIVHSPYSSKELAKGQIGTIADINEYIFEIKMESNHEDIGDDTWPFTENELELIWEEE